MRRVALALALALASPAAALAAPACGPWSSMRPWLEAAYGERPDQGGVVEGGRMLVVVLTSDKPAGEVNTWTMVAIDPLTKRACAISAGEAWGRLGAGALPGGQAEGGG